MQRVPKLVEQRDGEVEAQQRRLTGWWLDHVRVVEHNRKLAEQVTLVDEAVHPCATAL